MPWDNVKTDDPVREKIEEKSRNLDIKIFVNFKMYTSIYA